MSWRRKNLLKYPSISSRPAQEEELQDELSHSPPENWAPQGEYSQSTTDLSSPLSSSHSPPLSDLQRSYSEDYSSVRVKSDPESEQPIYNPRKHLMKRKTPEAESTATFAASSASNFTGWPVENTFVAPYLPDSYRFSGGNAGNDPGESPGYPLHLQSAPILNYRDHLRTNSVYRPSSGGQETLIRPSSWSSSATLGSDVEASMEQLGRDRSKTHPQSSKRPRTSREESVIHHTQSPSSMPRPPSPYRSHLHPSREFAAPSWYPSADQPDEEEVRTRQAAEILSRMSAQEVPSRVRADTHMYSRLSSTSSMTSSAHELSRQASMASTASGHSAILSRMSSVSSSSSFSGLRQGLPVSRSRGELYRDLAAVEREEIVRGSESPPLNVPMDYLRADATGRRPSSPNAAAQAQSYLQRKTSRSPPDRNRARPVETPLSRSSRGPPVPSQAPRYERQSSQASQQYEEMDQGGISITVGDSAQEPSSSGSGEKEKEQVQVTVDTDHGQVTGLHLKIIRQPESHYRPRYQKEGSRGCVKDSTGRFPLSVQTCEIEKSDSGGLIDMTICFCIRAEITYPKLGAVSHATRTPHELLMLNNWEGEHKGGRAVLQVFIGSDSDPVSVHPWYRVCIVGGRTGNQARIATVDTSTTVLELDISPGSKGLVNVNCLGIVKLRNSDLEQSGAPHKKDTSSRRKWTADVRLVFRAIMTDSDGQTKITQAVSSVISCTPSSGVPQIQYTSINQAPASGGSEIVVIGRNLIKGTTRLCVQETSDTTGGRERIIWQETVQLLPSFFTQVHLVAKIPAYSNLGIRDAVPVALVLKNNKKCSQPFPFLYVPASASQHRAASDPPAHPPRLQRHVSVQCVIPELHPSASMPSCPALPLPRELRPYLSDIDRQSLERMDMSPPLHRALPPPSSPRSTPSSSRSLIPSHSDSDLESSRRTLFPLSPHDTAFLGACGLDFDHRVENGEATGVPQEWSAPRSAGGVVRVRPRASMAFQWARARARTARSVSQI